MYVVDKVLVVDAGNTSIKYTYFHREQVMWQYRDDEGLAKAGLCQGLEIIYLASVRSQQATQEIRQDLQQRLPHSQVYLLTSQPQACGVLNAYAQAERLGVDRWLTVIAAHHHVGGDLVIVDAGTAVKVDVVSAQGQHLGGYITPGLALMEQALLSQTARVRYQPEEVQVGDGLPDSTARAVAEGCQEMVLGFLDRIYQRFSHYQWLVTGGDGEALLATLGVPVNKQPYLVALGAKLVGDEQLRGQK